MTGMLASVNSSEEALMVLNAGADIIDLKQPAKGALGALDIDLIKQIVELINHKLPVSATIGDLPMQSTTVFQAVEKMADTEVDFIKIGFFPDGDWVETIDKLASLARQGLKLIAVLFADTHPDLQVIPKLSDAGFTGVMLDTIDKNNGSLSAVMSTIDIKRFIKTARNHNLLCGLAGSLRENDVANLLLLQPDYLGFRGALCNQYQRTAQLNIKAIKKIKQALVQNSAQISMTQQKEEFAKLCC